MSALSDETLKKVRVFYAMFRDHAKLTILDPRSNSANCRSVAAFARFDEATGYHQGTGTSHRPAYDR